MKIRYFQQNYHLLRNLPLPSRIASCEIIDLHSLSDICIDTNDEGPLEIPSGSRLALK
jgi:hypothetical protein